jgi:hypothetical protein
MSKQARIHSIETLKDVKAAVAEFCESVAQTLASVDADINRITQWLHQDRPAYWKREVRKREEDVAHAQSAIMRKRIISAPEPASIVEEQKVLNKARQRLGAAQKKLDAVRRWAPIWEREALLYKTTCRGLAETIHRDMPAAAARLESMMTSLDAYMRVAVPQTDGISLADLAVDPDASQTEPGHADPGSEPPPSQSREPAP